MMARPEPSPGTSGAPAGEPLSHLSAAQERRSLPVVDAIVEQHVSEASFLWSMRGQFASSPSHRLNDLAGCDRRLEAHLGGLRVAAASGWRMAPALGADTEPGMAFTAAVQALEQRDGAGLDALIALAEDTPALQPGVRSAFSWVSRRFLEGVANGLFVAGSPFRRALALDCCAAHRVDPGRHLDAALSDRDMAVRQGGLRLAVTLGRSDLLPRCERAASGSDPSTQLEAARCAVLLGDRGNALRALKAMAAGAVAPVEIAARALPLAMQALSLEEAHVLLQHIRAGSTALRPILVGSGVAGDPAYVSWLITHMRDPATARLAGEAFSLITGADLVEERLEQDSAPAVESGPNDDPDDADVAMDPDEQLVWPDAAKVQRWWETQANRYQPRIRYFMGAPLSRARCTDILKSGYQRQRILAAQYLCLLEPGTPLFSTSAPAWRQQRLLAQM
jgi:uncharacterized protein (TIGR02270 family)